MLLFYANNPTNPTPIFLFFLPQALARWGGLAWTPVRTAYRARTTTTTTTATTNTTATH